MGTKEMAFAGSWYPASADECEAFIRDSLKEKKGPLPGEFVGGIVPHAGWYYSGAIACRVIAALKGEKLSGEQKTDTILLFGAHMHPDSPPFILSHGEVETPFGSITADSDLIDSIYEKTMIRKKDPAVFPDENTLELQFPFIKYFFPTAKIVICAVAPAESAVTIGKAAAECALAMGRDIRIVGSTDMTHYGPNFGMVGAGTGKNAVKWVKEENDRKAIDAMIRMDEMGIISRGLSDKSMCCPGAAAAAVAAGKTAGAVRAVELDYATSFEKSASSSFVGYSGVLYSRS